MNLHSLAIRWCALLAVLLACGGVEAAPQKGASQSEGFTPTPNITITFRDPVYPVSTVQKATVTINGPQSAGGNYTVSVTGPGTTTSISLRIGGATGGNTGKVSVNIPAKSGNATYTASVSIAGQTVSDDVTVKAVLPGSATLSILRLTNAGSATVAPTYETVGGNVGGEVVIALHVPLKDLKLSCSKGTVRVRELPDTVGEVSHGETQDHVDLAVDFGESSQWQKLHDPDGADGPKESGWWPAPEAPTNAPAGANEYRRLFAWNTAGPAWSAGRFDILADAPAGALTWQTGQVWNHNGAHQVSLSSVDATTSNVLNTDGATALAVAPLAANVQNLVISEVSTNDNQDYFIFDPSRSETKFQQPEIKFTIKDEGERHQYRWWVYIEPTTQPGSPAPDGLIEHYALVQGTASNTGAVIANWDGLDSEGSILERGTYTFDIYVEEVIDSSNASSPSIDDVDFRSHYTGLSEHGLDFHDSADDDDDESNDEDAAITARVKYQVFDSFSASANDLTVRLIDHGLDVKATYPSLPATQAPAEHGVLHEKVDIYTFTGEEEEGMWRALFTAKDRHADKYRDHQNRRILALNQPKDNRKLYVMIDPGHGRNFTGTAEDGSPTYIHNRTGIWSGWRGEGTNVQHASLSPTEEWMKLHEGDAVLGLANALRSRLTNGKNNVNNFRVRLTRTNTLDLDSDPDTANEERRAKALNWFNSLTTFYEANKIKHTPHVVMLSIHSNGGGTTAHGTESHYKSGQGHSNASLALAQAIHNRMTLPDNNAQKPGAGRSASNDVLAKNWTVFGGADPNYQHIPRVLVEMLYHSNTEVWAPGATLEFNLLRNGLSWTEGTAAAQGGDAIVTYDSSTEDGDGAWWGFTRGSRALRYGINDYFSKNKNAP